MKLWDKIKNIMVIPDEDDYENEAEETTAGEKHYDEPTPKKESSPRIIKSKTISYSQNTSGLQVVLVKPERFDEVTMIADHLNEGKTVVLNLEECAREISRRIVDFLSGATYANHGNMRKISKGTFLIVPEGVDMMGELMLEEFEENKMYF